MKNVPTTCGKNVGPSEDIFKEEKCGQPWAVRWLVTGDGYEWWITRCAQHAPIIEQYIASGKAGYTVLSEERA